MKRHSKLVLYIVVRWIQNKGTKFQLRVEGPTFPIKEKNGTEVGGGARSSAEINLPKKKQ